MILYRHAIFSGMEIAYLHAVFIQYGSGNRIAVQIDTVQVRCIFGNAEYSTGHNAAADNTADNNHRQQNAEPMNFIFYFFLFRFL